MAIQEVTKEADRNIIQKIKEIVESEKLEGRDEKLQEICRFLEQQIEVFDWVGFYLVDPEADRELILGPYVGEETDHTRIPFGKGICGQTANSLETFVVQDVSQEENYLSCSADVKAEIVVPIMKDGEFVAELDIDSHLKDSITKRHKALLEEVCDTVAVLF